ncbi:hypothetical protein K492DRAFT_224154 [Lichtheimia hyalospora FSU 10163]|nr:hypothetical protein K492DRAFT_224154 [Lichtheimia hyalospora FSU 10163]
MIMLTTITLVCLLLMHTVYGAWDVAIGCQAPCTDVNKDAILAGTPLSIRSTGIPENVTSYTIFFEWGMSAPYNSDIMLVIGDVLDIVRDGTGVTTVNVSTPSTIPPGDHYFFTIAGKGDDGLFSVSDQIVIGPLTFQSKAPVYVPTIPQNFTANLGCYGSCANNTVHPGDPLLATWSQPPNISEDDDYVIRLSWGNAELVDSSWTTGLNGGLDVSQTPVDQAPKGVNVTIKDVVAPGNSYYLVIEYTSTISLGGPTSFVGPFTIATS